MSIVDDQATVALCFGSRSFEHDASIVLKDVNPVRDQEVAGTSLEFGHYHNK